MRALLPLFLSGCVLSTPDYLSQPDTGEWEDEDELRFSSDLCGFGGNGSCWGPGGNVAVGTTWTVAASGGGSMKDVESADEETVSVTPDLSQASLTAKSEGYVTIIWTAAEFSDTFPVKVSNVGSLSYLDRDLNSLSWFSDDIPVEDLIYGSLPPTPGDVLRVFEGNTLTLDVTSVLSSDGDHLWHHEDALQVDGESIDEIDFTGGEPAPEVLLSGVAVPLPSVESASVEDIAALELVVFHDGLSTMAQVIALDSDGHRLWAPDVEWEWGWDLDESFDKYVRNTGNGSLRLYWYKAPAGAQPLSISATVGDAMVSADLTVDVLE